MMLALSLSLPAMATLNASVGAVPNAYVAPLVAAGWTGSNDDITRLNTLSNALMAISVLSTARAANKLLVSPFVGSTVASRKMCLFHPSGAGTAVTTSIADANITNNGILGNGSNKIDSVYDGTGLGWQDVTLMFHGRYMATTYTDAKNFLIAGSGTKVNGETSIMHYSATRFITAGSTFNFGTGGYNQAKSFQSGTVGVTCLAARAAGDKQHQFRNDVLASSVTEAGTYASLGASTNTFKFLANNSDGEASTAEVQTVLIAPGLDDTNYLLAQAAVATFNAHRRTYNVAAVSSPKVLWIAAGQSNMTGVQTVADAVQNKTGNTKDENHPNVKQWLRAGSLSDGVLPFDFDPAGSGPVVSPMMAFAARILELSANQQIVVIPAAKGASGFSSNDWNPGNTLYEAMLTMVNAAIAAGCSIGGMVWNQGESDTSLTDRQYADAFEAMLVDLKSRVTGGWPAGARVIMGQIANPNAFRDAAMNLIVAEVANTVYVTGATAGVTALSDANRYDDGSKIHYSPISQRLMGIAYANAV